MANENAKFILYSHYNDRRGVNDVEDFYHVIDKSARKNFNGRGLLLTGSRKTKDGYEIGIQFPTGIVWTSAYRIVTDAYTKLPLQSSANYAVVSNHAPIKSVFP